jgi:hypothetical protein
MLQHKARGAKARSQLSQKNPKGIAAEALAVYIGADIAYKHGDRPHGTDELKENKMAKKTLKKAKKLEATKSLTVKKFR